MANKDCVLEIGRVAGAPRPRAPKFRDGLAVSFAPIAVERRFDGLELCEVVARQVNSGMNPYAAALAGR